MIQMIGIDHTCAPVNVRSVFAIRKSETEDFMRRLKERLQARGIVLIATCNRMEVWISTLAEDVQIIDALCSVVGVDPEKYRNYFVYRQEQEAISHLFLMTSGLKSAILAEDQILTQVKDAIGFARMHYFSDNVLEVLFRMAVSAGKRVKTEVRFTRASATAIEQALQMLEEDGFSVAGKDCMVIGNGMYGKLAAQALLSYGAKVTVTVRQYHSGIVEIPEGCKTIMYGDKMELFPSCALVVSATASPNYTLFYDKVCQLAIDHEMMLIDLAVPRDIDPMIAQLPWARLYDIDDFQTRDNSGENAQAFKQAQAILQEEMDEFAKWRNYRDLMPRIDRIRETAGDDVERRIVREIRKLPLDETQQTDLSDRIVTASGKVVGNLLYVLRDSLDEETLRKCVESIEAHYNLGVKE